MWCAAVSVSLLRNEMIFSSATKRMLGRDLDLTLLNILSVWLTNLDRSTESDHSVEINLKSDLILMAKTILT